MFGDIAKAVGQLDDRRFLGVVGKAVALTVTLLAASVWGLVTLLAWVLPETLSLPWLGTVDLAVAWISWAAVGLLLVLSVFLMIPIASVFVGFFLDDIADRVEARFYPGLPAIEPLPMGEVLSDTIRFLGLMILVNIVALVIYLLSSVLAPFVFWAVNGFLLGREYFQLVAARRLGHAAARALRKRHSFEIWLTGAVMAVPLTIPVVNLVVPVLGVAAFTHLFHRLNGTPG